MNFLAQLKDVRRTATSSNDTEYKVLLVTDVNLKELMDISADEMVIVEIKKDD